MMTTVQMPAISGHAIDRWKKEHHTQASLLNTLFGLAVLAGVVVFLIVDSEGERERLMSALGVVAFILIGFICSAHPAHIRWRHVFWGIGIEFTFGLLVLRWEVGRQVFQCLGDKVAAFLGFADAGSGFVFSYLVTGQPLNVSAISKDIVTLPEILSTSGWHTAAIVNMPWLNPEVSNVPQGITEFARGDRIRKADETTTRSARSRSRSRATEA